MKYILSFLLLWLVAFSALAQPYGDAKFKQKFNKADALFYDGSYTESLALLEEMYAYDTTNANLNYLLGVSYLLGKKDHNLAIKRLESATKDVSLQYSEADWKERKAPGLTYLYLGKAYHFKNQFDKAVANYYNYRSYIEMDDVATYNKVRLQIQYAENAMELTKNPVGVKVTNLGSTINTKYSEYCPVVSADGQVLIFTSRREGGTSDAKDEDGNYYDDIYVCQRQANGNWGKPQSIGPNINSAGHEAAIGLSPNGQLLFIYKDDNGDGNIYFSEKKGAEWTQPQRMGSDINTTSWETHATTNATQDMLVFVSNRSQGGYGGRDLWYCKKLPNGEWGLALNMGSVINTQYEEDSPFISADGQTLIFSSQGHTSMGGFDIFRSEFQDGQWSIPENIGYPINTSEDDVFFTLTPDGRTAYYSSRMDGGFGDSDLYKLRLEVKKSNAVAVARGVMKVPAMAYADIKAKIIVTDEGGAQIGTYRPNAGTGYYVLVLKPGESYKVTYEADGYPPIVANVPIADDKTYEETGITIELKEVVFGENILALQKETERLGKEKEAAKAKAAEEELLAAAALKAEEEAQKLALAKEKEAEKKKAEELAALEKEQAANDLAAEEGRIKEAEAARKSEEAAKVNAQQELAVKTDEEAETRAAEQARLKQEAKEVAKAKAQQELAVKTEAQTKATEQTRLKQEAEEAAKAKAQQELAVKTDEEAKIKAAEQIRLKQEAEEAAKAKAQQELAVKTDEEAQTKATEQTRLKQEAEEAAKAKAQQELAAKTEAETKAAEQARLKQETEEAAKVKAQQELAAKTETEAEAQKEIEAEFKSAEEALLKKQADEQDLAKAKSEEKKEVDKVVTQTSDEVAITESDAERELRIAEAEKRRVELQERIQALKKQQEQQAQIVAAPVVREVAVQETESNQEGVSIDAEAIRLKRDAMLKRIEQLKRQRVEVEAQKVEDEKVVVQTSEKVKIALAEKTELEEKSDQKVKQIAVLKTELQVIEEKVGEAKEKVEQAEEERLQAEKVLIANTEEEKRLAKEQEQKVKEAIEVEKQLKEQEEKRLAEEKLAAAQFEKQQQEEAERTKRELVQLEAIADQQRQVNAALAVEERKKAAIDAAEKSAYSETERLSNASTLEQLRDLNRQLIADNLELKKQLAELNRKLDLILARMDYQPDPEKVEMPASNTMKNLQEGKRLILRNIFFDYNLATLRSNSKHELNKLFDFMKGNSDVKIVVSGHTDAIGNDDYNLRLSKDRAQAVVDYLVRNGIASSRLTAVGYGETRPIARNENADNSDNAIGRQLNRRIEISMPKSGVKGVEMEPLKIPTEAQIK